MYNSVGGLIKELQLTANGFVQERLIDLGKPSLAGGVYYLKLTDGTTLRRMQVLKL